MEEVELAAEVLQFNESYEGKKSQLELLELEHDQLLQSNPGLREQLAAMPQRVFSGKAHPKPDTRGIYFCFRLPVLQPDGTTWSTLSGPCRWLLVDLTSGRILEEPTQIAEFIRCLPLTPRRTEISQTTLAAERKKIDTHLKNTYLKSLQAPLGVKPVLKAWMELN